MASSNEILVLELKKVGVFLDYLASKQRTSTLLEAVRSLHQQAVKGPTKRLASVLSAQVQEMVRDTLSEREKAELDAEYRKAGLPGAQAVDIEKLLKRTKLTTRSHYETLKAYVDGAMPEGAGRNLATINRANELLADFEARKRPTA